MSAEYSHTDPEFEPPEAMSAEQLSEPVAEQRHRGADRAYALTTTGLLLTAALLNGIEQHSGVALGLGVGAVAVSGIAIVRYYW
jgi:hypothetical protein